MKKLLLIIPLLLSGCFWNQNKTEPPSEVIPKQVQVIEKAEQSTAKINKANQLIVDALVIDWSKIKNSVKGQETLTDKITKNLETLQQGMNTVKDNSVKVLEAANNISKTVPEIKRDENDAKKYHSAVTNKILWFAGVCGFGGVACLVLFFLTKNFDLLIGAGVGFGLAILAVIVHDWWWQILLTAKISLGIFALYAAYFIYKKEFPHLSPATLATIKKSLSWVFSYLKPKKWFNKTMEDLTSSEANSVKAETP